MADEKPSKKSKASGPIAKKDHVLHQDYSDPADKTGKVTTHHFEIKKGEPLPDGIPDHLMVALKTEGVID